MTIPALGTQPRRILDLLSAKPITTHNALKSACSDIARPTITRILKDQIARGNVAESKDGYSLTEQAIAQYRSEASQRPFETKPLDRKYAINPHGNRPGSNDFSRDAIKSKHY